MHQKSKPKAKQAEADLYKCCSLLILRLQTVLDVKAEIEGIKDFEWNAFLSTPFTKDK